MEHISLINHASALITHHAIRFLSDPWYQNSAFNDGWDLLYQNPENEIDTLLSQVTHLYLSHEHPDHFSIAFFKKYQTILNKNNVTIFIQKTRDQRIFNFLNSFYRMN